MKHIKKYDQLFEARLGKGAIFSPGFLSNFKNLSSLVYNIFVGELNKMGGRVTIDYLENGDHSLIVIKVDDAEDIVISIMGIIEPIRRMTDFDAEWETTAEIAADDLFEGLESDSESVHRCLNSILPGRSSSPKEHVNDLARSLFTWPLEFVGETSNYILNELIPARLRSVLMERIEGAWPDPEKMQNYITTSSRKRGKAWFMNGLCYNFFNRYIPLICMLINDASLQAASRIVSELDVLDLFNSEAWEELQSLGWTNHSTERMLKSKSLSLQNEELGLNGDNSGSISIVSSGYVRKVFAGSSANAVLKKFPPFSRLEDYYKAFEYIKEFTFKQILADAGIKTGSKRINSIEDLSALLLELYKKGEIEPIARAWNGLPQNIKDLAVEMSDDPDFERAIKAFISLRRRLI